MDEMVWGDPDSGITPSAGDIMSSTARFQKTDMVSFAVSIEGFGVFEIFGIYSNNQRKQ